MFYRGRALWMVSVALLVKPFGPLPRAMWTPEQVELARQTAKAILADVGVDSTDHVENGDITYILRRQCRDDERRRVTEKYLQL